MYSLLVLFLISGIGGIVIGCITDIVIGYVAYGALVMGLTALLLGVSALIGCFAPTSSNTITYEVVQINDNSIVIKLDALHTMTLPKTLITKTINKNCQIPTLEIITVHFKHQKLNYWLLPFCLPSDIWVLYL